MTHLKCPYCGDTVSIARNVYDEADFGTIVCDNGVKCDAEWDQDGELIQEPRNIRS